MEVEWTAEALVAWAYRAFVGLTPVANDDELTTFARAHERVAVAFVGAMCDADAQQIHLAAAAQRNKTGIALPIAITANASLAVDILPPLLPRPAVLAFSGGRRGSRLPFPAHLNFSESELTPWLDGLLQPKLSREAWPLQDEL
uniref:Uncharacterized protein n=1 Tax=Prymnesium polylepis TaxID=72548 RepID=A0A7S4HF49_9EUKA|mmetsp:Transcript_14821/g.37705  ORF Transcript_14821/g.37705 Transcript_14821/m.37705 type:complete len:144 (+) Transcript_14821:1-432(+)